jgi:enolase
MALIASVVGRIINDSRGEPTVEVTLTDDQGRIATASLPSGSSIGKYEAKTVDAKTAITTINTVIAPSLLRTPLDSQQSLDRRLMAVDPTPNREKVGVNSLLGISLAGARLFAQIQSIPLYHYIQIISGSPGVRLPIPMFNLINGGKHANNNLDFQEYLIIPTGMKSFHSRLMAGRKVLGALGAIFDKKGIKAQVGFEGGYAPDLSTNEEGLGFLVQAIQDAGFVPGVDIMLGLDIAYSALPPTYAATVSNYMSLFENFPIYSLEDPLAEDDWGKWSELKKKMEKVNKDTSPRLLVGDDLFVGDPKRLADGVAKLSANAVLIKINQAATLTEIIDFIALARKANIAHILSHRSGETLDTFVSDLAVGTAAPFIKAGSPNDQAPERIIKYERIAEIEENINVMFT